MKALVIGAAGFVGKYLVEHLQASGYDVYTTKLPGETVSFNASVYDLDILEEKAVMDLFCALKPDYVFHLAAQSSVSLSWKIPAKTVEVNIIGTINILEAVKINCPNSRILLIGSSEEYGVVDDGSKAISELLPLNPCNVYAVTKMAAEEIGKLYVTAHGLNIIMTRSFNHIGAGQADTFVVSSFCKQIANIEKGLQKPVMLVGNLKAERDISDVRDIVKAYALLCETGITGEIYNVGSGNAVSIQTVLNHLLSYSKEDIEIKINPEYLRKIDTPRFFADISKIKRDTGWSPEIGLEQSLHDVLEHWREKE